MRFTSKERDSESGLDWFGARYYGSALGRFTSPDPANAGRKYSDPQSWNGYAYARNNPLKYTDPFGLDYRVCDTADKNCATIDDKTWANWRDSNGIHQNGDGSLWVVNQDGTGSASGSAGSATWFDPRASNAVSFLNFTMLAMATNAIGEGIGRLVGPIAGKVGAALASRALSNTASESAVTLFRAVSSEEADQVLRTGAFEAGDNSLGGKFFAESADDAAKWGDRLQGPGNYQILRVQLPKDAADSLMRWERLDGIGPARYGDLNQVNVPGMKVGNQ